MNFLKNLTSSLLDEQEKFTDLTQVSAVDADACLDVLHKRFENGSIYTHCGPLLVAVNPYAEVDGLYSDEMLEQHLQLMPADPMDPHVFGMAARAYQKMMASGGNQAVVISGESGAGKTETAKYLLHYLAAAASGTSHNSEDGRGSLQRAVMGSNPIMESYGCAKTVRNDNSSRFGKLVLLRFTKTGRLQAASLQTYLLEKSRVIHQSPTECNFHAFFEMIHGVDAAEFAAIGLPQAKSGQANALASFVYLNTEGGRERDPVRDSCSYERTREAMDAVGLGASEQVGVLRLLCAILHLGNISFGKGDDAKIDQVGGKALGEAAALLACEPEHLAAGMCTRKLKAGTDWVTTANSVEQASEVRHALVKQLYSYLFIWLVKRINASLAQSPMEVSDGAYGGAAGGGAPSGPHIAYVDIFGFEIFESNSLEQLCINFANEKLQRLFVGVLFESVQQMYVAEGLEVDAVEYDDNKKVVDLIGGAPQGLLAMLTEECVFPKGSDTTYLQKVCNTFRKNAAFTEVKTSPHDFTVNHFAGEVTYDVRGFLEKNKDPISQDLKVLVEFSDDAFVSGVMKTASAHLAEEAAAAAAPPPEAKKGGKGGKGSRMGSGKFVGVVDGFKASLRSLIATLQDGELHFIRCLKPNDDKAANTWNRDVSYRQLMSAGLVQAVQATREGYADHLSPANVVGSFGPLVTDIDMESIDPNDMDMAAQVLEACGISNEAYAVGKTKIFLRPGVRSELEKRRLEHIAEHATMVQAMVRGALARILLRRLKESARRKAEEKKRREDEVRRIREEAERKRKEAIRIEEEARAKAEAEEAERRKKVQSARSLSFDRKRRKKVEEEERKKREEQQALEARKRAMDAKREEAQLRMRERMAMEGLDLDAASERDIGASVDVGDGDYADEALQAPEPVGWEQRLDPRGNSYYCNTITNMTMIQHPVDYHYQQLYLQYKMQRQQQEQYALMSPRSRQQYDQTNGGGGGESSRRDSSPGSYKLDLRSINADGDDVGDDGQPQATPRGWLKRTKSLLTPRGSSAEVPSSGIREYVCHELEARVHRGSERLGMELNAYNQILSFQPGGPTDRHPDMKLHDRILGVDGQMLGSKMLTDILKPAETHAFVLERWAPPRGQTASRPLSPRTLLALGKARSNGAPVEAAMTQAEADFVSRHKLSRKKAAAAAAANDGKPVCSRFTVTLVRNEPGGGLGIVADEDNVVVDMVPGSPADQQRTLETKGDPRLQIGDKIMTVDGNDVTPQQPLEAVIQPREAHVLSIERTIEQAKAPASTSPMSPRGLLKAITPRGSRDKGSEKASPKKDKAAAPTKALREVRLYKASEDERLGIRFVRDDDGFDREMWGRNDAVTPIVAALDPKGEAARAGIEIDDMVLSINGQTGLSNTEAAAMLRDLSGTIVLVMRRTAWMGQMSENVGSRAQEPESEPTPLTPRSAMRRLV